MEKIIDMGYRENGGIRTRLTKVQGGVERGKKWSYFDVVANLLTSASSVCIGKLPSP